MSFILEYHKNHFLSFNKSSVSEILGVTTVCSGVVVRDFTILLLPGVAEIRGDCDGVRLPRMLPLPATIGVPVLAISLLAAGESICSRSELLGVPPNLARRAGLKEKKAI